MQKCIRLAACALLVLLLSYSALYSPAHAQLPTDFWAAPDKDDPGIAIPTLHSGQAAERGDQTRYATNAGCVRLFQSRKDSIVRVVGSLIIGRQPAGTGFFVSTDGKVAMCWHELASCCCGIRVITSSGHKYFARVIAEDRAHDLCILQIDHGKDETFQAMPLGSSYHLVPGEQLMSLGFVGGCSKLFISPVTFFGTHQCGEVAGPSGHPLAGLDPLRNMLWLNTNIQHGNSGSPVLNEQGQVVGIAESSDLQTSANATPVEDLQNLLNGCAPTSSL